MARPSPEVSLLVFVGRAGDHNDLGMAGAPVVGAELARCAAALATQLGTSWSRSASRS